MATACSPLVAAMLNTMADELECLPLADRVQHDLAMEALRRPGDSLAYKLACPHCGRQHLNERDIFKVSDGDELRCTECVKDSHVWGYSVYGVGWIEAGFAILIDGEYYTEVAAEDLGYNYSPESGEWVYKK